MIPDPETIIEDMNFFDDWDDRYGYILDLGKYLPEAPAYIKTPEYLVQGCQSQVWLSVTLDEGKLKLALDSDALIVKGLLALVYSAYSEKSPSEVLAYDIQGFFHALDLERHLSPTRGNGLKAVVQQAKTLAEQHKSLGA